MVQYAQPELLSQTAKKENLGVLLVEVVASVLDVEVRKIYFFFAVFYFTDDEFL